MRENRPIRLIRKRQPEPAASQCLDEVIRLPRPEPTELEIRTVVSRWVSDHRQRSEEFSRTFATLLRAGEFPLPTR